MGIFDLWAGFSIALHTIFHKTFTRGYPQKGKEEVTSPRFHDWYRSNRWLDGLEKCVGCELCAWAYPAGIIYVESADNIDEQQSSPGERLGHVYQIDYLRCISCGICIEAYPTYAPTMINGFKLADKIREKLIYEKQDLLAPLMVGMGQPSYPCHLGDSEKAYSLGLLPTSQLGARTASKQGAAR